MNFEYINQTYGLSVKMGQKVLVDGQEGIIKRDCGNYIGVDFEDGQGIKRCHPTWEVKYL